MAKINPDNFFETINPIGEMAEAAMAQSDVTFRLVEQNSKLIQGLQSSFLETQTSISEITNYIVVQQKQKTKSLDKLSDDLVAQEDKLQKGKRDKQGKAKFKKDDKKTDPKTLMQGLGKAGEVAKDLMGTLTTQPMGALAMLGITKLVSMSSDASKGVASGSDKKEYRDGGYVEETKNAKVHEGEFVLTKNATEILDSKFLDGLNKASDTSPPKIETIKSTVLEMLEGYEDVKFDAYDDGTGVMTIGFGATQIRDKETGLMRDVKKGDTITRSEAYDMKDRDYRIHFNRVKTELESVGVNVNDLPDNVLAPLVSVAFQYGSLSGAHKGTSSMWDTDGDGIKDTSFPKSLAVMVAEGYKTNDYSDIANLFKYNLSQDYKGKNVEKGHMERMLSQSNIITTGSGTGYYGLDDLNIKPADIKPSDGLGQTDLSLPDDVAGVEILPPISQMLPPPQEENSPIIPFTSSNIESEPVGNTVSPVNFIDVISNPYLSIA